MFDKAIEILYLAKQDGIDIALNEEELHVKLPKNRRINNELIGEIKGNKQLIVDFLKSSSRLNGNYNKIEKFSRDEIKAIPASYSQQRIWFIDQLEGTVNYHIPAVLRLKGGVKTEALAFALKAVLDRHEVLRTVIKEENGQGFQYILKKEDWQLTTIIDEKYQDEFQLKQLIETFQRKPFDLSSDYMLRATLVTLSSEEHVLLINMHHIASDGWSMSILVKEVVELYSSFIEKRNPCVETLQLQYSDYAVWQHNYFKGEILDRKVGYWKKKLEGLEPLNLPIDNNSNFKVELSGGTYTFSTDKYLTKKIQLLSQEKGTTMFMTLLAAFKVLLYNYSNQEDICVGTPIAGRQQPEIAKLIGNFVNTLALRDHINPDEAFTSLLHQVRDTTIEAFENQDVPFEKIVEILPVERNSTKSPVFQVMFAFQNTPEVPVIKLADLQLINESYHHDTAKFDLSVTVSETANTLNIAFDYARNVFAEDTIARMGANFEQLLKSIVINPEEKIGQLRIISLMEENKLLKEFSTTSVSIDSNKSILDVFTEQVQKTPDFIAAVADGESLTYKELDLRSTRLAHYLLSKGVESETLVPICTERSVSMIIGILGILKAGGAYVPIDPAYPEDRISFILEDTQATVLLSTKAVAKNLQKTLAVETIELDSEDYGAVDSYSTYPELKKVSPEQLAYVIYTSGSTGKPKGVKIEHRSFVNIYNAYFKIVPGEQTILTTNYVFDVSVLEIFSSLLGGGCLNIPSDSITKDPYLFARFLYDNKISTAYIHPMYLKEVAETLSVNDYCFLTKILIGVEPIRKVEVQWYLEKNIQVLNGYGPTETTICATFYSVIDHNSLNHLSILPIGKPIANNQLFILNNDGRPAPIGVAGEIVIGGAGLARGYLNRDELTEEKFRKIPFSNEPEARFYRSGDLGKWLPDGNLEYVGRIDDQVKIRGYRIEPGEIVSVLQESGLIRQAAVVAKKDAFGTNRLVGYVVFEEAGNIQSIKSYVEGKLPDYMVPSIWIELDTLPVTFNGKIDKKALPNPDFTQQLTKQYIAPRNEIEKTLADIWQELLGIERLGIHDNFFELGGHSILAMKVISSLRRNLGFEVGIKDLFVNPTIAALAEKMSLSVSKTLGSTIPLSDRPVLVPLSYSQERLWFMDQRGGSIEYHTPAAIRLSGRLDVGALERSLATIVDRHEVLRTAFIEQGGQPYQFIKEQGAWHLSLIEGSKYRDDSVGLNEYVKHLTDQPFDLSKDYMLRATLIKLAEEEHVLVVTIHHIASDAWSVPIIIKELAALYSSFVEGKEARLAPLALQYADYALWQRNHLTPGLLEEKINYWKAKLEDVSPLQLPTDYKRPALRSTAGATTTFSVDKEVVEQLHKLSRQEGGSLYMTLLAAFKVLLYRYSGQHDIAVGASIANRTQQEIEGLIGFFVNTLVFRDEVKGDTTFVELLRQVKATTLGAYEHQEVPFEKVVEVVVKERDPGVSPLFQVMLVMQNTPEAPQLKLGELTLSAESFEHTISKFDLTFFVNETAGGLKGMVQYRKDLFKAETIEKMMSHFKQLLIAVTKDPLQRVGLLPMLSSWEERELLVSFNGSAVEYPRSATVVSVFEDQVVKTPGATAVVFEGERLTYEQLNERANRLAHYLRSCGVKEDMIVPVYTERSVEMVVAIVGILKAGAGYVPIDVDFPGDRIRYMIEDSGSTLVLSSKESRSGVELADAGVEIIETDGVAVRQQPSTNPVTGLRSDHLAYVIYTSGSTGMPKGVMIEHRSLLDYVFGLDQQTQIGQCKSYALVSTTATDLGNTVIYSSLLLGGALHIFTKEQVSNIEYLHDYFSDNRIDCLKIVPSHWKALHLDGALLLPKKLLVFGGEALSSGVVEDIHQSGSGCTVVNHYGPTETTIGKLLHVTEPGRSYNSTIPIGKPFSNTAVYILSKDLQLAPAGIPGQLYIAGEGVARGYLNNGELTAKKFISNPFSQERGRSVMYGTGDLVKYLPDGNIEFIGRVDDQVKIRGYRVELGEIETVLQQCERVRQAVVVAREDKQGNKRLVGYIVAAEGGYEREEILSYAREKLPEYMVPSVLVELAQLPLLGNGKVNRKALPDPEVTEETAGQYVAPRNDAEARLAEIWQEVLEEDRVGVHDDFFELGGHSLLAVRLVSAIRKEFVVEIPISHVFDYPTVALLAAALSGQSSAEVLPSIQVIRPRPERIPLSFSQERLWFIDRMEGSIQYHVPVVLKLQGKLDIQALGAAMQQIVTRHEVLRTVFRQQDGEAFQVIQENVAPVMQVVNASGFAQDAIGLENHIKQLIRVPFNLSEDCMLRAHLIVLGEEEYILVATLHHIASDGWSRSILVGELAELYASANEKRSSTLKLLPVQYADFALWQRNYLSVGVLEKKLAYWKGKLAGVLPLDLPTDYVRPAVQGTRGAVISFQVDSKLAASLQHLSQKHGATLYMTLLSAFNVLLARYSGQQDICVGTPIAGRQQQELEGLIGFFVNTLAMRSQVDQDASFTALLQQVKTTTMEGYANQEIPFEKVVEAVVKERDLSRNPLFQVMFILRNTPDVPELRLGDIALSRTGYEHSTSLFDFSLFITETENGLHGAIEYSTDLYTRATIERMAGHFTRLLGAIVARPEEKTGQLALLTAQEEQTLLSAFNATAVPYPADKSVADLFEEQAQETPLVKAIVFEGEELSYQELDKRSNQLAHYLRGKGVREGVLVPIFIERSVNMVIGVLGILKSGAAYVPVDPEYPSDRIAYMLADSAAGLVVTSSQSRSKLGQAAGIELVELDTSWPCIGTQSTDKVAKMWQPDHLVYVMYTSGSTGKPKGVRMGGRGMVNLLSWQQKQFNNENRHVLQFASLTFDVSFQEIFSTLCFGSTLYLINEQRRKDMSAMLQDISEYGITHLFVPYIVLKSLVEHLYTLPGEVVMPQQIIVAGEQLKLTEDIRELIKEKGITLVNQYGPTEAHVVSSYTIDPSSSPALPPIGKPIDNTQLYVTDAAGGLCPVGVAGELCIGGVQVAQGYLNREALTAEKFIEDRFSKREGARLYRTGDVARWLEDGNLEYLGRVDEQVKVRGYRIELGEIESVVQQSGLVSQGVVIARNDSNGHKRLVGYIVAAEKFDKQAITSYLHTQLPDYMVPSIWVEMQSMPITPNGKIDKRALPDPDVNELSSHSYVAPRTETEKKLAEIWQQLLGVEKVGIHDNFFELGGHSLMVMRVVAYVERELSISIPIHLLFQLTSINELGKYIEIQNFDISKEKNTKSFKVLDV